MMMDWLYGAAGGALIGLGAVVLMAVAGRIAGISGILGGIVVPQRHDVLWRAVFIGALVVGAAAAGQIFPTHFGAPAQSGKILILAGLLVGVGVTLANGCTSGHGVCGLARLSPRSAYAVATFMGAAMITVGVMHYVG